MRRRSLFLSAPAWALPAAWPASVFATPAAGASVQGPATPTEAAGPPVAPPPADLRLSATAPRRLAGTWRLPGPDDAPGLDQLGLWREAAAGEAGPALRLLARVDLPGRAHGLCALPDGGVLVCALRPGRWLWRLDAAGHVLARLDVTDETPARTLDGHVELDPSATLAWTTETDPATGEGWLSARDARSLRRLAQWPVGGPDPHQLLRDAQGRLMVAVGGIPRDRAGRKRRGLPMAASLWRLDPQRGTQDRWTLDDPELSLRHLAWADPARTRLGVALQAEHADPARRREAPVLAVWEAGRLTLPTRDAAAGGYAGDIAPGPRGGFVISTPFQHQALWWHPGEPERLQRLAELRGVYALAGWFEASEGMAPEGAAGLWFSAERGAARWRADGPGAGLAWPFALAPDNHWTVLADPHAGG